MPACTRWVQGTTVGYNMQTAVDAKHMLIVEHEVTNVVSDQDQISPRTIGAKQTLGVETLDAVIDVDYDDEAPIRGRAMVCSLGARGGERA